MQTRVAFLGLGAMGLPMALNLQRKGFAVTGWNRSPNKGSALSDLGGNVVSDLREAVRDAEVVVTMLADPAAVAGVALGDEGFLGAVRPGGVWIEASTIGPSAARGMAEAAGRSGWSFVDAPVLGSVAPATEGTLHFLVGGADEAVTRVRPLLDAMGSAVTHLGPAGQGAAAKIVSNMITGTLVAALGEALALAERLGVDRTQMAELLKQGPVGAPIVRMKAPAMLSEQFNPAFQLKWMEKDIGLALKEALGTGASLGTAAGALGEYAGARAAGFGDQDFAAVGAFIRQMAKGPTNA